MITFTNPEICRSQAESESTLGGWSAPGLTSSTPDNRPELPRMEIGEQYRLGDHDLDRQSLGTDDGHRLRLHERSNTKVAAIAEIMEAGISQTRASRRPAVEIHTDDVNTKSKAVGYRADMLTTQSAHGSGDQHLHVSSVQQEPTAMTTWEKLPLGEGSMQRATSGQSDSMVRRDGAEVELKATKNDLFYFPKRLKEYYKLFLDATSEDFERGTLPMLKCKLCHGANFNTWDHFTRHCKSAESQPLKLLFCDRCGNFFARGDSLGRHSDNWAAECRDVSQHEAEAKRNETIEIHREFLINTKAYLETSQGTCEGRPSHRSSRRDIRTLRRDSRDETGTGRNRVVAKHPS
jgi:hypothetical protein